MLKAEPKGCAGEEVRKWGKKKKSKRWPQGFWSELGLELSAPTSILLLLPSALYSLFTDIFHLQVQNCPSFSCDTVFAVLFSFSFIFNLKVTKKQTKPGKHKLPHPELNSIWWDLEKEMATHSSVLAWRIPGTAELGGLPSSIALSRTRLKWLSSMFYIQGIIELLTHPTMFCPQSKSVVTDGHEIKIKEK